GPRIDRVEPGTGGGPRRLGGAVRSPPGTRVLEPLFRGRFRHRIPVPHHPLPPVLRGALRPLAFGSRRLCGVRRAMGRPTRSTLLLRPDRRIPVPRDAPAPLPADRRGHPRAGPRGAPRSHPQRDRGRRDSRRALCRRARLVFLTRGFALRGPFRRGRASFFGFGLGRAGFGADGMTGGGGGGTDGGGGGIDAASGTTLKTKSFSRTRSRTFMPTSCPRSARETTECSIRRESTVCSPFVVGPSICIWSSLAT